MKTTPNGLFLYPQKKSNRRQDIYHLFKLVYIIFSQFRSYRIWFASYLAFVTRSFFHALWQVISWIKYIISIPSRIFRFTFNKWQQVGVWLVLHSYRFFKFFYLATHISYRLYSKRRFKIRLKLPKRRLAIPKFVFASFFFIVLGVSAGFYWLILKNLPNPHELITRSQVLTTKIYARDGSLLYKIYRNQNRSIITMDQLPTYLINATIAAEDKNFWKHPGFSLQGILRAFKTNLADDAYSQGGSTITQQLVKNALLSSEKTFTRKIKEMILAIEVELMFTKQEILQMYFNEIPYGGVAYGVEEASESYFGKPARELNIAEAAIVAFIR